MEIKIPKKLEKRLRKDKDGIWLSKVITLKTLAAPLLENTYFFPDYTGHGADHVNEVLANAEMLIPAKALGNKGINSRDTALLVSAVILHDLGMCLTCAGLTELLVGDLCMNRFEEFDAEPWTTAWEQFIDRTKRYPEEKMRYLFGTNLQVEKTTLDAAGMRRFDRLVIGEFLRQNHGRLAHEIAVNGIPGSERQQLLKQAGFDDTDRGLIGILARSHCMSLREAEQHLGTQAYHSGTPMFYLMSVLRIADLLDAGEHRAPVAKEKLENIPVPLSLEEWTWNQCIKEDSCRWDPEHHERRIEAIPQSSTQYVRLDTWLRDVQNELELCWAVLAQKHANDNCKLSIHRVTCNIHDPDEKKRLSNKFVTRDVRVTANPEIVKLMMEPLYGDDPTFGVRELVQNAVDACVERERKERLAGNPDYKGLVTMDVTGDTFTITDNGMGMNEEIILSYYLSAGASYRSSEQWKADNAPDGVSQVARTGKFGVGFLAAFLLGDCVKVHTQYRTEREADAKGYEFEFTRESKPLDIRCVPRTEGFGTTITIRLKENVINYFFPDSNLEWFNWYAFDEPRVTYRVNGEPVSYKGRSLHRDPAGNSGWLDLPSDAYEVYQWLPNMATYRPEFYCNGIRIYGGLPGDLERFGLNVYSPHVSVIDKRGILDVDLSRQRLKTVPEKENLYREVFRWHIARLLLTPWDTEEDHRQNLTFGFSLHEDSGSGSIPFLLSSGGFTLNHAAVLPAIPLKGYVILYYEGSDTRSALRTARSFLGNIPCSMVVSDPFGKKDTAGYLEEWYLYAAPGEFIDRLLNGRYGLFVRMAIRYQINKASVWLREDVWESFRGPERVLDLKMTSSADGLVTACFRDRCSQMPIQRDRFPVSEFPAAVHVPLVFNQYEFGQYADSLFVRTLTELLGPDLWIPFDMKERREKFREAFKELKMYIEHIQKYHMK